MEIAWKAAADRDGTDRAGAADGDVENGLGAQSRDRRAADVLDDAIEPDEGLLDPCAFGRVRPRPAGVVLHKADEAAFESQHGSIHYGDAMSERTYQITVRKRMAGTPEKTASDPRVIQAYLGE